MESTASQPQGSLDRKHFVLAAIALQGENASFTPVQVQKLFFLIDREIPESTNGPHFSFKPYDYGPFDRDVYLEIEKLKQEGDAIITNGLGVRTYKLSGKGLTKGARLSTFLPEDANKYIKRAGEFVRRLSFDQLVSSIYKAYPEMRENSVFKQ